MNNSVKSAIIPKNITVSMYAFYDTPNTLETEEPYTYDYQIQSGNGSCKNLDLYATIDGGERYVYELGVSDLFEYVGRRYITSSEISSLFGSSVWLRDASSKGMYYSIYVTSSTLKDEYFYMTYNSRSAFSIDLSKVYFEKV